MRFNCLTMLGLTFLFLLSGCAQSFRTEYKPEVAQLSNAAAFDKITIGIAKFEDKRPLVEANNPRSEGFVYKQGLHKFGITYKGKEFVPVKDVVQDILIQEMIKAGFKIKAIDKVLSNSNSQSIASSGETQSVDYILGGQILTFDFTLQSGFVTVKNDKMVNLNVDLFRSKDMRLVMNEPVSATESKEYAMGLAISIAVHNLVNETMKIAAGQVVRKVADKITLEEALANK